MFVIDLRNKLVGKYCFSVMNNNDVDTVYIYSHFTQYKDYLCYLKVISEDETYVDEFLIDSEKVIIDDNALRVEWTLGAISTHCKKISIQLEFRESNEEDSKVAQSSIVDIVLGDTLDVSEKCAILYPDILKSLQHQIDELDDGSVASFTMTYISDVLTINLKNAEGESVAELQATIPTSTKVDKVQGKGLSTNDFTDALLNKLNSIAEHAQVNVLEGVQVDGNDLPIDANKKVNIANKVTKTDSADKVYGTDGSGNQTTYALDNGTGYSGNVARRDTSNQLHVPQTPTADDHAVSKKYADTLVANIKKDSYKEVDTTEYPTLQDFLTSTGEEGYLYLYPIDTTDLTKGYYRYVWEGNAWLDLGTTQIDLSDYYTKNESENKFVDKASNQTITGAKEFTADIVLGKNIYLKGKNTSNSAKRIVGIGADNNFYINVDNMGVNFVGGSSLVPLTNNAKDLGSPSYKWKDAYIQGVLYGASYNISIDTIYKNNYNKSTSPSSDRIELDYLNVFSKTADTTFTLAPAPTGCYPEYKAVLTNSGASPITITLPNSVKILTNNEEDVQVNGNTFVLTAGTSVELSIMNYHCVAIVF